MAKRNKHIGSSLNDFLKDERINASQVAPEPEVLTVIGEDRTQNETNHLASGSVQSDSKPTRKQ